MILLICDSLYNIIREKEYDQSMYCNAKCDQAQRNEKTTSSLLQRYQRNPSFAFDVALQMAWTVS